MERVNEGRSVRDNYLTIKMSEYEGCLNVGNQGNKVFDDAIGFLVWVTGKLVSQPVTVRATTVPNTVLAAAQKTVISLNFLNCTRT